MIFAPYPGSADFERLVQQGQVEMDEKYHYLALVRSGLTTRTYNPQMGTGELLLMQYLMLVCFYLASLLSRPWRLVRLMQSLWTGREQTQLHQLLRTKREQWIKVAGR